MGAFSLRRPKRKDPEPAEQTDVTSKLEPESVFSTLALEPLADEPPDEVPGVPDLYAIIGVDPASSDDLIRYAYRRKAAKLHERRWRPGQAMRQLAELNAAYEILGKPDRRADYDRRRARRAAYERAIEGRLAEDGAFHNGRPLRTGARSNGRRLRLMPGGVVEAIVILAVVGLAVYAAYTVLSSRSLVDLSRVVELGESLGLNTRRRAAATPAPAPSPAPTAALPAGATIISPPAGTPPKPPEPTAPARPANRFQGSSVSVNNPTPNRRSDVAVEMLVLHDGRPVPGAEVYAIVHYRTVDERWPQGTATQPTDASGKAIISFNIGDATPGHPVNVDAIANVDGERVQLQTSFTPR